MIIEQVQPTIEEMFKSIGNSKKYKFVDNKGNTYFIEVTADWTVWRPTYIAHISIKRKSEYKRIATFNRLNYNMSIEDFARYVIYKFLYGTTKSNREIFRYIMFDKLEDKYGIKLVMGSFLLGECIYKPGDLPMAYVSFKYDNEYHRFALSSTDNSGELIIELHSPGYEYIELIRECKLNVTYRNLIKLLDEVLSKPEVMDKIKNWKKEDDK